MITKEIVRFCHTELQQASTYYSLNNKKTNPKMIVFPPADCYFVLCQSLHCHSNNFYSMDPKVPGKEINWVRMGATLGEVQILQLRIHS
jgi:hypothetical protein